MATRNYRLNNDNNPQEKTSPLDGQSHRAARALDSWRLKFDNIALSKCGGMSLESARQHAAEVFPMLKLRWHSHNDDHVDCNDILSQLHTRADIVQLIIMSINVAQHAIMTHGLFSTEAEARLYLMGRIMDHYRVPHRL